MSTSLPTIYIVELQSHWTLDHQGLLQECRNELADADYAVYQHGLRKTRALGCDGPMCRKAARDYGREVMRRVTGVTKEYVSSMRRHDEFLDAYIQFAARRHAESGIKPPRRRKLKVGRTYRKERLIPLSTAKMLHQRRARLAS